MWDERGKERRAAVLVAIEGYRRRASALGSRAEIFKCFGAIMVDASSTPFSGLVMKFVISYKLPRPPRRYARFVSAWGSILTFLHVRGNTRSRINLGPRRFSLWPVIVNLGFFQAAKVSYSLARGRILAPEQPLIFYPFWSFLFGLLLMHQNIKY